MCNPAQASGALGKPQRIPPTAAPWKGAVAALDPSYSNELPVVPVAKLPESLPSDRPSGRLIDGFEDRGWREISSDSSDPSDELDRAEHWLPRRGALASQDLVREPASFDYADDVGKEFASKACGSPDSAFTPRTVPAVALASSERSQRLLPEKSSVWRPGGSLGFVAAVSVGQQFHSPRSVASEMGEQPMVPLRTQEGPSAIRALSREVWCEMTSRQDTEDLLRSCDIVPRKPFCNGSSPSFASGDISAPALLAPQAACACHKELTAEDLRFDQLMVSVHLMPTLSEHLGEEQPPTVRASRITSRLPCKEADGRLTLGLLGGDSSRSASSWTRTQNKDLPAFPEAPVGDETVKLEALPTSTPSILLGGNPFQVPLARLEPILEDALHEALQKSDKGDPERVQQCSGYQLGPTKWAL